MGVTPCETPSGLQLAYGRILRKRTLTNLIGHQQCHGKLKRAVSLQVWAIDKRSGIMEP